MSKEAQSNDYYLPIPEPQTTFAATDDSALDTPLPQATYLQHPVGTGIMLGLVGAGAGGTYAGLHNLLSKQPVGVAKPMLLGAAIGSALGGLIYAKDKAKQNMRSPKNWREINERVYRRMYGAPLYKTSSSRYMGLRLLTGPMQKNAQWYNPPKSVFAAVGRGLGSAAEKTVRGIREMAQARAAMPDVGPGSFTAAKGNAPATFGQAASTDTMGKIQDAAQRFPRQIGRMLQGWSEQPTGSQVIPAVATAGLIAKDVGPYFVPGVGAFYRPSDTGNQFGSGVYNLTHGNAPVGGAQVASGLGELGMRAVSLLPGGGLVRLARAGKLAPMLNWANRMREVRGMGWVSPTVNKARTVISRMGGVAPENANRLQKTLVATESTLPTVAAITGGVAADAAQRKPNEINPQLIPVPGKPGSYSPYQPEQAKEIRSLMESGAFRNPRYIVAMNYLREHPDQMAQLQKQLQAER